MHRMSNRQTGAKVFFFSSLDSTTIICLKPNAIVSLLVAAAVAILALTAVKIPQDITRKREFSFARLLSGSERHYQRQWGYFIHLSFTIVQILLPADVRMSLLLLF